tara:strand:- start:65290 stop:65823 length:534 start_codon:yes stop_codon:yes gene_type:complete
MNFKNKDDEALFKEMTTAPDRSSVIVSTSYLDDKLTKLLKECLKKDENYFRQLFKPTGPLGAMSNKAKLAYLMGLITKEGLEDVLLVADIRNRFAHWAKPLSFRNKDIRDKVESITLMRRFFDVARPVSNLDQWAAPLSESKAKQKFVMFIIFFAQLIESKTIRPSMRKPIGKFDFP